MTTVCIINSSSIDGTSYSNYDQLFRSNGTFLIVNDILKADNILIDTLEDAPFILSQKINTQIDLLVDTTATKELETYTTSCNLQYYPNKDEMKKYCKELDQIVFLPLDYLPMENKQVFINSFLKNLKLQFNNEIQVVYFYNTFLLSQFINEQKINPTPHSLVRYIKHQINITDTIREQICISSIRSLMIQDIHYTNTEKNIENLYSFLQIKRRNRQLLPTLSCINVNDYRSLVDQLKNTTLACYLQ
jgi:ribosomal protein L33